MKKNLISILVIILSINIYSMYETKYTSLEIDNQKILFPVQTSIYLENLLYLGTVESYYELAVAYQNLGFENISQNYIKKYEDNKGNFELIGDYYLEKLNYTKALEYYEKYADSKSQFEKDRVYLKIKDIIIENNLHSMNIENYNINNLSQLKLLINDENLFYNYYYDNTWSSSNKNEIANFLSNYNLSNKSLLKIIFYNISNKYQKLENERQKIASIYDKNGYFSYFNYAKLQDINIELRDIYEEIYYYDYIGDKVQYNRIISNLINQYIFSKDYDKLNILYNLTNNNKILYNLALNNEIYFINLIEYFHSIYGLSNRDLVLNLINNYNIKFPNSKKKYLVDKILIFYIDDYLEKYELSNKILQKTYDNEIAYIYLDSIRNLEFLSQEDADKIIEKNDYIDNQSKSIVTEEEIEKIEENHNEDNNIVIETSYNYEDSLVDIITKFNVSENIIELYKSFLIEKNRSNEYLPFLESLCNKDHYISYCLKYGISLNKISNKDLILYYFFNEKYENLIQYKSELSDEIYDFMAEKGYFEKKNGNKNEKINIDLTTNFSEIDNFQYFYFNNNKKYITEKLFNKFIVKDFKNDAEIYFLAKYYLDILDYKKAKEEIDLIVDKYASEKNIVDLYNEIEKKLNNDKPIENFDFKKYEYNFEYNYN